LQERRPSTARLEEKLAGTICLGPSRAESYQREPVSGLRFFDLVLNISSRVKVRAVTRQITASVKGQKHVLSPVLCAQRGSKDPRIPLGSLQREKTEAVLPDQCSFHQPDRKCSDYRIRFLCVFLLSFQLTLWACNLSHQANQDLVLAHLLSVTRAARRPFSPDDQLRNLAWTYRRRSGSASEVIHDRWTTR